MTLPDLDWQWLYSRFAWGLVLAALLLRAGARWAAPAPGAAAIAAVIAFAAMWLPGAASAAYWLGLMFQYPSVMLVACLLVGCSQRLTAAQAARPHLRMHPRFALVLALGGAWLYADSSGWLNMGLYARGFDPRFAPAAALCAAAWAVWALRSATLRGTGLAVLACSVVFCLTRLPSGNLFDALLDPWLWCWSVCAAVRAGWRRLRRAPPPAEVEHAPVA